MDDLYAGPRAGRGRTVTMRVPAVVAILGLGLGVLLLRSRTRAPMLTMTLRERAIEAQKISERTSQIARDLAEKWSAAMKSNTMGIAS
jgi:hypothetical protein